MSIIKPETTFRERLINKNKADSMACTSNDECRSLCCYDHFCSSAEICRSDDDSIFHICQLNS